MPAVRAAGCDSAHPDGMPRRAKYDSFAIDALIQQRGGVVRTAELRQLGMSASTITYRYRAGGPWQRALPGIILTFAGTPTDDQRRRAALLYCGGGSMFTGLTALTLYGARHLPASRDLHVLVPHRRHRASSGFVVVERTRRLPEHRRIHGWACAPIARAAIDASRRILDLGQGRALLAELVQRRMCPLPSLADELLSAQIRGSALPRRVLKEVRGGVRSAAEAEAKQLLLRNRFPPAQWNCNIYDEHGEWLACPDAIWVELVDDA